MIVGIDPGYKGAIAFLHNHKLLIHDLPTRKINSRLAIDGRSLASLIRPHAAHITLAVIEDVHAMPRDGVASAFRFGYGAGVIQGIFDALEIKTLKIKPSVWKNAKGLNSNKKYSIDLARKLFPDYREHYFRLLKHDGRAEAAILAHYASEVFGDGIT